MNSHRSLCILRLTVLLAVGLGVLACAPQLATPKGFVVLDEESDYDYRATTADGLVLAARRIDNDPHGELAFWQRAIENEMRYRGGYALLETRDVASRHGFHGRQLRFGHDESREPHLYYVTLFLGRESSGLFFTTDKIYLLEAGGPKPLMEKHAAQIDWAIREFDPDNL